MCVGFGCLGCGSSGSICSSSGSSGSGSESLGIKVEVPEAGTGKRYAEGWVVVKILKE